MIKLQVIGHLGKDCVVNQVNGKSVINFSVAHSEKFKDAQGVAHDKTIWVDCGYWSDRVAVAPYLKQGTMVFVEGQPEVRQYTTKDGRSGANMSLRVVQVQLLGGKQEGGSNSQQSQNSANANQQTAAQANSNYYPPPSAYQNNSANEITEPLDDLPF